MSSICFLLAVDFFLLFFDKSHRSQDQKIELAFPSTIDELKTLSSLLGGYSKEHPAYVIVLFSSAYLFKQTFAIPGSVFMVSVGGSF